MMPSSLPNRFPLRLLVELLLLILLNSGACNSALASAMFEGTARWRATLVDAKNVLIPGDLSDLFVGFIGRPLAIGETAEVEASISAKAVGNSSVFDSDAADDHFLFQSEPIIDSELTFDVFEITVDLELHIELQAEASDTSRETAEASFDFQSVQAHEPFMIGGGCFQDGCVLGGHGAYELFFNVTAGESLERTYKQLVVMSFPRPTDTGIAVLPFLHLEGRATSVSAPVSFVLLGLALAGLGFTRRRLH